MELLSTDKRSNGGISQKADHSMVSHFKCYLRAQTLMTTADPKVFKLGKQVLRRSIIAAYPDTSKGDAQMAETPFGQSRDALVALERLATWGSGPINDITRGYSGRPAATARRFFVEFMLKGISIHTRPPRAFDMLPATRQRAEEDYRVLCQNGEMALVRRLKPRLLAMDVVNLPEKYRNLW
jgi:hypothetical protein